jgi:molecular chaperone DnaJ
MEIKDPYSILGVSKNATEKEIKIAYKRLAVKYHPDKNKGEKGAEEKFKKISWAYDILSDPKKKQAFDQYGPEAYSQMGAGGQSQHASGFGDYFDEIFREMFGGGSRRGGSRSQVRQGANLEYSLEISLEDAVFGKKIDLTVPRQVSCEPCGGSGSAQGSAPQTCGTCGGHGQVRMQQGIFSIEQTCPQCHGEGRIISNPCSNCRGQGLSEQKTKVSVTIPAGIDSGNKMRLSGYGHAGPHGGPAGDLYLHIQVLKHKVFDRQGDNLFIEVPISFATAALGGEIDVPTLDSQVTLKVPAGTQSHSRFRLAGRGVPRTAYTREGDLICQVIVEIPVHLSEEQKEMIKTFSAKSEETEKQPMTSSWLKKIQEFLGQDK